MLEKYIIVQAVNGDLDAGSYHPCGVTMCSDGNGKPFLSWVEPFALFDTYEDAVAAAKKEAEKILNDIQDYVASGWSISTDCNFLYECYKDEAWDSGVIGPEDRVWLFEIDIHRVPIEDVEINIRVE